jgi:hypothetical protein
MLLKSINAMLLMLYLIRLLLAKAALLAAIKMVYSFKFSLFITLKIGLIRAMLLYLSVKYFCNGTRAYKLGKRHIGVRSLG